jgi:hypothetical protein
MTPPVVSFDWDEFRAYVRRLQLEHASRSEAEGVALSRAAFDRWGCRPPSSFLSQYHTARRRHTRGAATNEHS